MRIRGTRGGDAATLQTLRLALKSESPAVRENGARGLGNLQERAAPAVRDLIDALSDADADVRYWSIWALGRIGPPAADAALALRAFTESEERRLREGSLEALDRILGVWKEGEWRV